MTPDQFAQLRRNLSTRLVTALVELFGSLGSWRDADAQRFTTQAVPLVQGSQRTLAGLVAFFIADRAAAAVKRPIGPPAIPNSLVTNLRGVNPTKVYTRPFMTVRWHLSQGQNLTTSIERGSNRLAQIAEGDLQQTYAEASRAAMRGLPRDARPLGWRRVLHGVENCGACVMAATRLYTLGQLNPLHHHCDCTAEPVYSRDDIDGPSLEDVHAAIEEIAGGRVTDAKKLRGLTIHHGELGTLLVRPKDHHRTQADLPTQPQSPA